VFVSILLILFIWGLMAAIQRDIAPDCLIVREKKLTLIYKITQVINIDKYESFKTVKI
jgi:hypothetical protein